ncbi:tRNA-binding protein [Salibacteraceae bacterium]|jgi:tRNA-binding protein|nr:tRNA-binding protein [Salibacteraceae bacterium]MDB9708935.1 tRNA-binding protein [Salibacteraceae bacterium]HAQ69619.1 tRNA-binding protein [Flavobacteriales bacterium]
MDTASCSHFNSLDIRVGVILKADVFPEAMKPAYVLTIDFGKELGMLKSSAQLTELYKPNELIGTQILAVVNFPPKQIANFMSECLVLGVYSKEGVVLLSTERPCDIGDKLG